MCPKEAKIAIFEDDPIWTKLIKRLLESDGHLVVLEASTLEEAYKAVKRFDELGVQVATIDGNLNSHISNGDDGRRILEAIREQTPNVKTIGISGGIVEGVDVNVGKKQAGRLANTVTNL